MRTDDYKKSLDQIKCSDEFRQKMEDLLSQPAENFSGYETKFTVEKAPKISVSRYVAIAAALVFIVGAGSVAMNSMRMGRNLDNAATESSVYENNAENVAPADIPQGEEEAQADAEAEESADAYLGNTTVPFSTLEGATCEYLSGGTNENVPFYSGRAQEVYAAMSRYNWELRDASEINIQLEKEETIRFRFADGGLLTILSDSSAYIEGETETAWYIPMDGLFEEIRGIIQRDTEGISAGEMFDTNLSGELKSCSLRENAGSQSGGKAVYFNIPDTSDFREAVQAQEWQPCEVTMDEYLSAKTYFIGNLFFLEDGRVTDGANGFQTTGDPAEYLDILRNYIMSDDLSHMQYIIVFPEKTYDNMSAHIDSISYTVMKTDGADAYTVSGSGKLACESGFAKEYVEVNSADYDLTTRLYATSYLGDYGDKYLIESTGSDLKNLAPAAEINADGSLIALANQFYNVPGQEYENIMINTVLKLAHYSAFRDDVQSVSLEKQGDIWVMNVQWIGEMGYLTNTTIKADDYGTVLEESAVSTSAMGEGNDTQSFTTIKLSDVRYDGDAEPVKELSGALLDYFLDNAEK